MLVPGVSRLGQFGALVCVSSAAVTIAHKRTHTCYPAAWSSGVWMGFGAPFRCGQGCVPPGGPRAESGPAFPAPGAPAGSLAPPSRPPSSQCLPPSTASLLTSQSPTGPPAVMTPVTTLSIQGDPSAPLPTLCFLSLVTLPCCWVLPPETVQQNRYDTS